MSEYYEHASIHHGSDKKIFKSYIIGFVLSILLTIAAFVLIEKRLLTTDSQLYIAVAALAVIQLIVQVICFLRLNAKSVDGRWDLIAFIFTILVIGILVSGSLWIMYNLNYNMMN